LIINDENSIANAAAVISVLKKQATNHRATISYAWGAKQDLYLLKSLIEDALRQCPKFPKEDQWLKKQEQSKIIRILKDE
jgi:hypothetical protein